MTISFFLILYHVLTIRVNNISALVLQEKALRWVVEHMITDIKHLLALDESDNIQVVTQLLLPHFEQFLLFASRCEPVCGLILSLFLMAPKESLAYAVKEHILVVVLELLPIQD